MEVMIVVQLFAGEIQSKGVLLPFKRAIYRPMLKRLQKEGIIAKEHKSMQPSPSQSVGEEVISY